MMWQDEFTRHTPFSSDVRQTLIRQTHGRDYCPVRDHRRYGWFAQR